MIIDSQTNYESLLMALENIPFPINEKDITYLYAHIEKSSLIDETQRQDLKYKLDVRAKGLLQQ